jgi:hypothetical protein
LCCILKFLFHFFMHLFGYNFELHISTLFYVKVTFIAFCNVFFYVVIIMLWSSGL